MLQAGMSRIRFPMKSLNVFNDFTRPGVYSSSNRNEYQEQGNNVTWE
jgi:hypothetical protein